VLRSGAALPEASVMQQDDADGLLRPLRRRDLIGMLGAAATLPRAAAAQATGQPRLVGLLLPEAEAIARSRLKAFRDRLQELGYREGSDYRLAVRYTAPNDPEVVRRDAAELLALAPALVLTNSNIVTLAMHRLTSSVPVVFAGYLGDPVASGFAASYAHPGGNMTGVLFATDLAVLGKQLALLKEMTPAINRVEALVSNASPTVPGVVADAGARLGLTMRISIVANAAELLTRLNSSDQLPDAYFFGPGPQFIAARNEIVAFVDRVGRPALFAFRELADAGGLISYGADIDSMNRAAADYAAKILGGAAPGDLPIDMPALYKLVINLKTAKAQGIAVPPGLLARADEVIE
jgi:putative ABC transport system substrate-binding protein